MTKIGHLFYNARHISLGEFIEQCIMIVKQRGHEIDHVEIHKGECIEDTNTIDVIEVENVIKNHVYVIWRL